MKKCILFILFFFINMICYSQIYKDEEGFTYSHLIIQHPNGRVDYDDTAVGAIIFTTKNGKQIIGISLDREGMYQGIVIRKEQERLENGNCIISYEFNSSYQGINVPVVLTAVYGDSASNVPFKFFLTILNKYTRKPVRYNIFTGIVKSYLYK